MAGIKDKLCPTTISSSIMEIMRKWIAPLVEAALCSYLGEPFPDEVALRNSLKLVEDDNTLRVRVGDQKLVQVAQVCIRILYRGGVGLALTYLMIVVSRSRTHPGYSI